MRPQRTRPGATLAVLMLASSAYLFAAILVIPAFGVIARELDASPTTLAWLLTAMLLTGAVGPAILGRFGDMFGKRRMLALALAAFAAGCMVSGIGAVADSTAVVIAGRALQGLGAAAFPLGFGIVRDEFPPDRVAPALAALSGSFGIGAGLGLVLSGPILDLLSWDWLFWAGGVVVVAALAGTLLLVPESPVREPARIDWIGAVLLAAGLVALLTGVSKAESWGWGDTTTIGLITAGAVVLAAWLWAETRVPEPLVDLRVLTAGGSLATHFEAFAVGFAQFGFMAVLPLLVQTPEELGFGFGAGVTGSGLFLLPGTVAMMVIAPLAGPLGNRYGSRMALLAGAVAMAAGFAIIAAAHDERWHVYLANVLFGAGLGLALGAIANLVVQSVEPAKTGVAAGVNAIARTVGGALGTQIAATIIAGDEIAGTGLPTESGYTATFLVCAGAIACVALTAVLVRRTAHGPRAAEAHSGRPELGLGSTSR
jgi:MFS family permease